MEGREHMIRNEINILKRISQGNKNILSLVDYFETLNNCKQKKKKDTKKGRLICLCKYIW
jgi:hypothetical protein